MARGRAQVRDSRCDDGPGIAEELQPRVFDPFFTTKEAGKGTGLGLSVAYAIVQEHGGRIWLSSTKGAGASFYVELPIVGGAAAAKAAAGADLAQRGSRGCGCWWWRTSPRWPSPCPRRWPTRASSSIVRVTAKKASPSSAATYDLIICDLQMPRIDGMQFYRAMAAATPTLARRVIFVTGAVAGTDAERFLEETGCRWLAKPFRLGDLLRAARDALA